MCVDQADHTNVAIWKVRMPLGQRSSCYVNEHTENFAPLEVSCVLAKGISIFDMTLLASVSVNCRSCLVYVTFWNRSCGFRLSACRLVCNNVGRRLPVCQVYKVLGAGCSVLTLYRINYLVLFPLDSSTLEHYHVSCLAYDALL